MIYTLLRHGFIFLILFTSQLYASYEDDNSDARPKICWKRESEGVKEGELCKFYTGNKHYLGVVKIEKDTAICDRVFEGDRLHKRQFEMLYGINRKVLDEFQSQKEEVFIAQYPACIPSGWDRPMPKPGQTDDPDDPYKVCLAPDEYDGQQIGLQDSAAVCHRLGGNTYKNLGKSKECELKCQWVTKGVGWAYSAGAASNIGWKTLIDCLTYAETHGYKVASHDAKSCGVGDWINYGDRADGRNIAMELACKKICP